MSPTLEVGKVGQFDVIADGTRVASRGGNWFTRQFGVGYPDFEDVIGRLRRAQRA